MLGIMAGISAAGGLAKGLFGMSQAKKAQDAIDSYRRQDLTNVMENIEISTKGSDFQKMLNAMNFAQATDALRSGGARTLMGGLPTQYNIGNQFAQKGAVDLDQQFQRRQYAIAQDEARIRQMQERREEQDLAGLGQQLAVGQQNMWGGFGDVSSTLMQVGMADAMGFDLWGSGSGDSA